MIKFLRICYFNTAKENPLPTIAFLTTFDSEYLKVKTFYISQAFDNKPGFFPALIFFPRLPVLFGYPVCAQGNSFTSNLSLLLSFLNPHSTVFPYILSCMLLSRHMNMFCLHKDTCHNITVTNVKLNYCAFREVFCIENYQ